MAFSGTHFRPVMEIHGPSYSSLLLPTIGYQIYPDLLSLALRGLSQKMRIPIKSHKISISKMMINQWNQFWEKSMGYSQWQFHVDSPVD